MLPDMNRESVAIRQRAAGERLIAAFAQAVLQWLIPPEVYLCARDLDTTFTRRTISLQHLTATEAC
jgi:hypothetical protein